MPQKQTEKSEYYTIEKLNSELSGSGHQKRLKVVGDWCEGKVLDMGAGLGMLKNHLRQNQEYKAVDLKNEYVEFMKGKGINAVFGSAERNECYEPADTIVLAEILEHLENPGIALSHAFSHAKKKVILTLPNRVTDPWHFHLVKWNTETGWLILEFEKV